MILGNVCTRPCGFCSVPKGKTEELSADEPDRVAESDTRDSVAEPNACGSDAPAAADS
jgi:lipoate synthase